MSQYTMMCPKMDWRFAYTNAIYRRLQWEIAEVHVLEAVAKLWLCHVVTQNLKIVS